MANAADIPAGRRGNYRCPFCGFENTVEAQMTEHRQKDPNCRRRNDAVRSGVHPTDLDRIVGRQLSPGDSLLGLPTGDLRRGSRR